MDADRSEHLARLFKALADPARLRILGAVAERPLSGRELAEQIGLTPPTISHHMARLTAAGLVRVTADAQRRLYALDRDTLNGLSRDPSPSHPSPPPPAAPAADADPTAAEEAERAKVLRSFFVDGRLRQIPAQRKKRVIVLQHLLAGFEPDRAYLEREVNDRLREAHEDVATLRRELVDYGFMTREAGIYRVAGALPARGPTVAQEITGNEHGWLRELVEGATARALAESGGCGTG
ncbi:MAG: hypothetical protein AVDCRST_MAG19-3119 [uncultured Thermomicrobiales bacterium]|uniref:HTH arsR-type domain-containing protein n=1 Tax=uncultured Thermomicrobiales bacterium TaxID=1645740 RepID=A0A6J4VHR3_9BACT|nr:MAG: hypothetical protein AVDCRST_MAG19-3119 [uncultured Thermomicrobiales bacterium]